MAVRAEHHTFGTDHIGTQVAEQFANFIGGGIAHGVGHVQCGGAGSHCGVEDVHQKITFGAKRIFGRKLNIIHMLARQRYTHDGVLDHLLAAHVQFELTMQRAGGNEGVDARRGGTVQGACAGFDIAGVAARQCGNRGGAHVAGDGVHRAEIGR